MATNSLHSRQRDHRLLGGSNNIQYQREARQPSSATHASTLQQSGTAVYNNRSDNVENGDLETPRPLTEEELNPNLVAQSLVDFQRGNIMPESTTQAVTADAIKQLSPSIKSLMTAKLSSKGKNGEENNADNLKQLLNNILKNRNSIITAIKSVSMDLYNRATVIIPTSIKARAKKPEIVDVLVACFQILYELFQFDNHNLGHRVLNDLENTMHLLETTMNECIAERENEKYKKEEARAKPIKLTKDEMMREYGEGGGKEWRNDKNDGGDDKVEECPCCGLKNFDKHPDYDRNVKYNNKLSKEFDTLRRELKAFKDGDSTQPPLDKDGRPITSVPNPKLKPLTLQCHNYQNWNSCVSTGKKCRFGCKYDGKQYPLGKCPVCVSACRYAWDRNNHAELCQYFQLKKLAKESTPSEKAVAAEYLDGVHNFGNKARQEIAEDLHTMKDNGVIDLCHDEIDKIAKDMGAEKAAKYMVHNPCPQQALTFYQRAIAQGGHQNGPGWSVTLNQDMRQHSASRQRAANTGIEPANPKTVEGIYGLNHHEAGTDETAFNMFTSNEEDLNDMQYNMDLQAAMKRSTEEQFMLPQGQFAFQQPQNNSVSPMPNSTGPSALLESSNTPEHLSVLRNRLMDHSLDESVFFDEETHTDTLGALHALDDTSNSSHTTLLRFSKRLHEKAQQEGTTPNRAEKVVEIFKRMKRN